MTNNPLVLAEQVNRMAQRLVDIEDAALQMANTVLLPQNAELIRKEMGQAGERLLSIFEDLRGRIAKWQKEEN